MAMTKRSRDPVQLVSLRQLRYFSAAAGSRSFNEAARECAISQPALSEQIAALEAIVGQPLFDRAGGHARPTLAGQDLGRRVSAILAELQAALLGADEAAGPLSGTVRVGLVQSYGECWVMPAVREALTQWPAVSVILQRRTATALSEGVLRGDFDFAVSFDPEPHADLEVTHCFAEPFVAVGLKTRQRALSLAQIADHPLALLPSEYAMRRRLDAAFARQGLRPSVRLESDAFQDLLQAASEGGMVALVNAGAAASFGARHVVPIAGDGLSRSACLIRSRRRHQPRAARQLWAALLAGAPVLPERWRVAAA